MTYAGDSPSKKDVRLSWWRSIAVSGVKGPHLALAGPDCADALCAASFGIRDVTLVEKDKESYAAANQKLPGCVLNEDVTLVASWRWWGSALLDLCGTLPGSLATITRVGPFVQSGGLLGVVLSYGREKRGTALPPLRGTYGYTRRSRRACRSAARREARREGVELHEAPDVDTMHRALGGPMQRALVLAEQLNASVALGVTGFDMHETVEVYTGHHHPMMLVTFTRRNPTRNTARVRVAPIRRDDQWLRRTALDVARDEGTRVAAARFNLEHSTVCAWKAHETRGSYT